MRGFVIDLRGLNDAQVSAAKAALAEIPHLPIAVGHPGHWFYVLVDQLSSCVIALRGFRSKPDECFVEILSDLSKAGNPFDSRANYGWRRRVYPLILDGRWGNAEL
jgi:hypothetical protein